MPVPDPDATVIIRRRPPVKAPQVPLRRRPWMPWALAGIGVVLLAGGGVVAFEVVRPVTAHAPRAPATSLNTLPSAADPLLNEPEILAEHPDRLMVARFAANPRILVLDFPNLKEQGSTFNRVAAFVEKAGQSRDRVPNDAELAAAVHADHATVETYYYGHDYRLEDIRRFFMLADQQRLQLAPEEVALRGLLQGEGLLTAGNNAAIISIPREGSDPFVDPSGRASLLRHELSHGEFFTNPDYAAYAWHFWSTEMNESDRNAFRTLFTRQGYDPDNQDLMVNEMQAHLMNTTDSRYFNSRALDIPVDRVEALRAAYLAGMPAGWLRDADRSARATLP